MIRIAFYLIVLCFSSCDDEDQSSSITTIVDKQYADTTGSLKSTFQLEFRLGIDSSYDYCCANRKQVLAWLDGLPEITREDLAMQRKSIDKIYYVADALFDVDRKYMKILEFDRAVEDELYRKIGMHQGLPSVIFSTRIVASEEVGLGSEELTLFQLRDTLQ